MELVSSFILRAMFLMERLMRPVLKLGLGTCLKPVLSKVQVH